MDNNFTQMVLECNQLKALAVFADAIVEFAKEFPKYFSKRYVRKAKEALEKLHAIPVRSQDLQEAETAILSAKASFDKDLVEFFNKFVEGFEEEDEWFSSGDPFFLGEIWSDVKLDNTVHDLFVDYINKLTPEVPGLNGMYSCKRGAKEGQVDLILNDLSDLTLSFEDKKSAKAFFKSHEISELNVAIVLCEGEWCFCNQDMEPLEEE